MMTEAEKASKEFDEAMELNGKKILYNGMEVKK